MAGIIKELHGSRVFDVSIKGGSAIFRYMIFGEPDEAAAYELVKANSPETWYEFSRTEIDMKDRPNLSLWFPVVHYQIPEFPASDLTNTGDPLDPLATEPPPSPSSGSPADTDPVNGISFSVTTEMQRVIRAIETISVTGIGFAATPDFGGLVGVHRDGTVDGVDVPTPVASFRRRVVLQGLRHGYFRNLLKIVGRTNRAAWWGFPAEDLLLNGVTGQQRNPTEFEVDFDFRFSPTLENIEIRTDMVVPIKAGWHYLWTKTRKELNAAAQVAVEMPHFAIVDRVIQTANFDWLGI